MIFNVNKDDIFEALNLVSTVIEKKNPIEVLMNVHISANENGTIELQGSNLLNHIKATVQGDVTEAGVMTVSALKFLSMVKEADDDISIKYQKGGIAYLSFGTVDTELAVTDPGTFPVMRNVDGKSITMNHMVLGNKLGKAVNFVSHDETRKMLTGVNIKTTKDKLKIASTNSHQLFCSVIDGEFEDGINIIVSDKSAKLMQNMCATSESDAEINIDENGFVLKCGNYQLFTRLIDSEYPNYEGIIPSYEGFAEIDRAAVKRNVRLASIIMDDYDKSLNLEFENSKLTVHSRNANSEKVKNTMPIEYDGNNYKSSINSEYFTNIINNMSGKTVKLYFNVEDDGKLPLVIKSDHNDSTGDLCLVMPVRS